ncbi:hypothetical protein [Shewanella algae]|uniref:hypothetical protein n=1 Tax=Shewanella algae TaxID=38313 RepID=UPI001F257FFC|nr:hypothetical protein [Shewanella algae]MCE9783714.1 hypothetical protein [Shewanella algae]
MEITVFFAGYGDMEGQKWANAQMLTDFTDEEGRAGCQVGKLSLDTADNNRLGKHLVGDIQRAKGPIVIKADFGSKTQGGKIVSYLKSYSLVGEKAAPAAKEAPITAKSDSRSQSL